MRIVVIVFFFYFQSAHGQEYHFDRVLQYKITGGGNSEKNFTDIFINSKNSDYYFSIGCYGNEVKVNISDIKNNIIHYYTIDNIANKRDFKYLFSRDFDFYNKKESKKKSEFCKKATTSIQRNTGEFYKVV